MAVKRQTSNNSDIFRDRSTPPRRPVPNINGRELHGLLRVAGEKKRKKKKMICAYNELSYGEIRLSRETYLFLIFFIIFHITNFT